MLRFVREAQALMALTLAASEEQVAAWDATAPRQLGSHLMVPPQR